MASVDPAVITTASGADAWLWIGPDERGRDLEIIGIEIESGDDEPYLLVLHVMPTGLRR